MILSLLLFLSPTSSVYANAPQTQTTESIQQNVTPKDIGSEFAYTKTTYGSGYDSTGVYFERWQTTMTVKYRENKDGTFTVLTQPTITFKRLFSSYWRTHPINFTTSYTYGPGRKSFTINGSYNLRASIEQDGYSWIVKYFGNVAVTHTIK